MKRYRYRISLLVVLAVSFFVPAMADMTDDELMTFVQEGTFSYFWDFAHPVSGLSREGYLHGSNLCTSGGTGMGIMTIVVGAERGFVTRSAAADHILKMFRFLEDDVVRYHGVWPHWFRGDTGATVNFSPNDDGGDIVETAFLVQGILTARQYFDGPGAVETEIRSRATSMWESVEWDWHLRRSDPGYEDSEVMYWHWSPNYGWEKNFALKGYYEAMIVYILGVASPTHPIPASCYFNGWASKSSFTNEGTFYGYRQWVSKNYGGPLFWTHYSFLGFDPRFASDGFCNYYRNNRNTSLINRAYCIDNPKGYTGYGENCWGLTASTGVKCDGTPDRYGAWSPTNDCGNITPTAAISAMPYTPTESLAAMRHFYYDHGDDIWGTYGFIDAFNLTQNWFSGTWLAIDQGTIVPMIENYRTGLCWDLFMSNSEIQPALDAIGFINDPYDNMLENPGFEDGSTGSFSGGVVIDGWTKLGTSGWVHPDSGEVIGRKTVKSWSASTGVYQDVAVVGGRNYDVSAYLASFSDEPLVNRQSAVKVEWYDGGASLIKTDTAGTFVGGVDPYDQWKYIESTLASPDDAVTCRVIFAVEDTTGSSSGTAHADGFCVVKSFCPVTYDGDLNQDCYVNIQDIDELAGSWLGPYDMTHFSDVASDWLSGHLAGHWPLDESAGSTAPDISLNAYSGLLVNMDDSDWVTGVNGGNALDFDGIDDYVKVPGFKGVTGTTSRTCMAWVKTTDGGDIFGWGNSLDLGTKWRFRILPTGLLAIQVGGYVQTTSATVNDGSWHHVVVVLPAKSTPLINDLELYIDGNRILDTTSSSGTEPINTGGDNDVKIGTFEYNGAGLDYFNGLIDDVRIYSRALSEQEIQDIAN